MSLEIFSLNNKIACALFISCGLFLLLLVNDASSFSCFSSSFFTKFIEKKSPLFRLFYLSMPRFTAFLKCAIYIYAALQPHTALLSHTARQPLLMGTLPDELPTEQPAHTEMETLPQEPIIPTQKGVATKKRKRKQEYPKKIDITEVKKKKISKKSPRKKLRHNLPTWESLTNKIINFAKKNNSTLSSTLKSSTLLVKIFENSTDDQKKQIQSKFIFDGGNTLFHKGKEFRTLKNLIQLINNIKTIVDIDAKNNSGETATITHLKKYRGGACAALLCAGAQPTNLIKTMQDTYAIELPTTAGGTYRPYYNIIKSLTSSLHLIPKESRQSILKQINALNENDAKIKTWRRLALDITRSLSNKNSYNS